MNDNINDENKNSNKTMDLVKSKLSNFMIIIIVIFVIVVIFLIFSYLGKSNNENSSTPILNSINDGVSSTTELLSNSVNSITSSSSNTDSKSILGIIFGIIYFILFIIITVLLIQYFFKVDITQPIKNMFIYNTSQKPEHKLDVIPEKNMDDEEDTDLDMEPSFLKNNNKKKQDEDDEEDEEDKKDKKIINKVKSFSPKLQFKEVYHVPGNHYGYEESKSLCKALGGELADIKQMEDVYKKGGGWCSYGWSNNQMVYFQHNMTIGINYKQ